MNTEKLNKVSAYLSMLGIEATQEMIIGVAIKALVDAGYTIKQAYDDILGEGQYESLAGKLYDELNIKS